MWAWIILGGYTVFVVVLVSCVARAALSRDTTPERRDTAYRMFRIIWPTSLTGLVAALINLHTAGLL